jgi:O-antigen ligase
MGALAIALLVSTCISTILSPVIAEILGVSVRYGILLLLFIALDRTEFSEETLDTTRYALTFTLPVALILLYFNGDLFKILPALEAGERPIHSQTLPYLLSLMFPWYLLGHRGRIALIPLGLVFAAITWVGQSRAMVIVAYVTLLIVLFVRLKRNLSSLLVFVTVTVVGLLGFYSVTGSANVADAMMAARQDSDDWRRYKMQVSMESFGEHPIFGVGPGGEGGDAIRKHGEIMASENGLVQSLADSGLVGTTLFLVMLLYPARQCFRLAKRRVIGREFAGALMVIVVLTVAPLLSSSGAEGPTVWLLLVIANKHVRWAESKTPIATAKVSVLPTPP